MTDTPRSQDFIYAAFTEVVCPTCDAGAIFGTKAEAKVWARNHKFDHMEENK